MKPLLVLGSSNIDHIAQMVVFPQAGETLHGEHYHRAFGGKGANQAVAAAKSGAPTHFISAFGDDAAGGELRAHLESLGIDCDGSKTVAASTGMAMIWLNQTGENSIVVIAGANAALDAAHVAREQARIAHAGLLLLQLETPLEGVIRAAEIARAHGVRTILNPAPAAELPRELLANLDFITPNETEAERLTGITVANEADAARAAAALHAQGVPTVLITLGSRGVYASAGGNGTLHPAYRVQPVDTTAAGDTFNGALAAALLRGEPLARAIAWGQAAAALSVQTLGAQPSIPDAAAIAAFLHNQNGCPHCMAFTYT
ncbi:MAG: ribokinase [Cardiobacterium sp.]|nr:MAG: ribokinase [Cardiobacterium sp.]